MRLRPQPNQGERELARNEVRHAGADERLFEGLPELAKNYSRYLVAKKLYMI